MELTDLIAAILGAEPSEITDDRALNSFADWSSLRQVQLIAALESAYGVRLTVREIKGLRTVADLRGRFGLRSAS